MNDTFLSLLLNVPSRWIKSNTNLLLIILSVTLDVIRKIK